MSTPVLIHTIISLVGIASGLVVVFGLLGNNRLPNWTLLFLGSTLATCITGFFLPAAHFMPSHVIGIITTITLLVAIYARYGAHLAGVWTKVYVIAGVASLYFNLFVGVVQSFMKIPALKPLAPTQSEPPFVIAQLVLLALVVTTGIFATLRFRPRPA